MWLESSNLDILLSFWKKDPGIDSGVTHLAGQMLQKGA